MNKTPDFNDLKFQNALSTVWNYMHVGDSLEKADLIIGCGCTNLEIPIKCAELVKSGYADKILFTGGLGKYSKDSFAKPEAEIYRDIAVEQGINPDSIYLETESTNTGDNFRYSLKIISEHNLNIDSIILVHTSIAERRTLYAAEIFLPNSKLSVTSSIADFDAFWQSLLANPSKTFNTISCLLGDVQRIIVYPQFGWQKEHEVPQDVIQAYYYLKNLGYDKEILSPQKIQSLIDKHGLAPNQKPNFFN